MQAGIGEEKELSVIISYQSSVRVEEKLSGGGAVGFVRNAKWSGGIVDGSESGTNPESNSGPPVNVYLGVPTKFHLPQAKDSCTGRK
jgi:hypothetical protein